MVKGIRYSDERNNYVAHAMVDGKRKHIGTYDTFEEAKIARDKFILDPYFYMSKPNVKQMQKFNRYSQLLKITKKIKTLIEAGNEFPNVTQDTIRLDLESLADFGYVEKTSARQGKFNQIVNSYKALKSVFDINDLVKIKTSRQLTVAKYNKKVELREAGVGRMPGARLISFEGESKAAKKLAAKLIESNRTTRRSTPKNVTSGATMSASVW